ncbi:MAG: TusE/DsrC/DsvC family sulfur relay protein [Rhodobacterales bacterium]|nr:TusE/DsrC/DsvC family sulfur relay protein [Rhodobacterales bacterium]
MSFEFDGNTIETNEAGYMANQEDWSEDIARHMATADHIDLSDRHWDVINFLREEYFDNNQTQPNTRTIVKAMSAAWGEKIKQGDLYELFPGDPSKQGGKIAGLPESRRKGGY